VETRTAAPRVRIGAIDVFERAVVLRLPFRFGASTVRTARQAFARVRVESAAGATAEGWAADLMVPGWFDKCPSLSQEADTAQLHASIAAARAAALAGPGPATPWRHAREARAAVQGGAARPANRLLAGFGLALVERALIDAVCRLAGAPFERALRANLFGLEGVPPDAPGLAWPALLASLALPVEVDLRHTLGLLDPLRAEAVPAGARPPDGLPVSLDEVIAAYAPRWLKLKIGGGGIEELDRLRELARLLDERARDARVTLDGNECFPDVEAARVWLEPLECDPSLASLRRRVAYLEQPLRRDRALAQDVRPLSRLAPVVIDESDDDDDAFVRARACGYAGISVKSCKGVYRALVNLARCRAWNEAEPGAGFFLAGEDLTAQPGLALQQDVALATVCGIRHVERNGHHYGDGMAGAPAAERERFAAAHPDLYALAPGALRLRIRAGRLALGSLACAGFASAALPDVAALSPLEV
jgi:hypothetical protein